MKDKELRLTFTKRQREELAGMSLNARGWLSCWGKFPDDTQIVVRAGNLSAAIKVIDKILSKLGHVANGRCR